jgi:RNA polymerase primary sigma factor
MAGLKTLYDTHMTPLSRNRAHEISPSARYREFDETEKSQVYRLWRGGISVAVLSRQLGLPALTIDGMIAKTRARRILEQTLEYIDHPSFDGSDADATILVPMPESRHGAARSKPPADLPPYIACLYAERLLSREQEAHLFRKMNFLKFRACKLRAALDPTQALTADLDEIERLQGEALTVKNLLIRSNLRLVVSIAKKRVGASNNLFELISDGNMSLIRAVEKFDFSRGFKFSTYASWAIMKNFSRTIPEETRWRNRFVTGQETLFAVAADDRLGEQEYESDQLRNCEAVRGILDQLNDRERKIVVGRYGLDGGRELTLERLGRELGITKERVRQIESRAHAKLRQFARRETDFFEEHHDVNTIPHRSADRLLGSPAGRMGQRRDPRMLP